jgi:hypothetical protein
MIALKEMQIAMAMVIEDCDAVTMAELLEMSGAMMMYVMMALKEMPIAMAMVIEDCDAVTMAVMLEMRGAMMMYMMMALKDIDRWNLVFSAGNAPTLRI